MKKFGRNILAVGLATLLVTAAVSFSANGADPVVAQASAQASVDELTGGALTTGEPCSASTTTDAAYVPDEHCGNGLSTSGISVFSQNATAKGKSTGGGNFDGVSTADSSVAPIDVLGLNTSIDLSTATDDLQAINTGTILDDVLDGLAPLLKPVFELLLDPVLTAVQTNLLTPLTAALAANDVDVSLNIGAVNAACSADPSGAIAGDVSVAGISATVKLPEPIGDVIIPITVDTAPNSPLVASVPEITTDVLNGLVDTLNGSLNGILAPLGGLVDQVTQDIVGPLLTALQPVLDQVGTALEPLVAGTVNKQTKGDGSIAITALEVKVADRPLDLANVSCGKNTTFTIDDDDDEPVDVDDNAADDNAADDADQVADANADADADAAADADSAADADVTTSLPNTGASANLLPFWLLGLALVAFGGAVLVNERRRI